MNCPHGLHSRPESCSQCLGAIPRKVEIVGASVAIDGVVARPNQVDADPGQMTRRQRARGGRR